MGAFKNMDISTGDMRRRLMSAQLSLMNATTLLEIERGNAAREASSDYEDVSQIHDLVSSALNLLGMVLDDIGGR